MRRWTSRRSPPCQAPGATTSTMGDNPRTPSLSGRSIEAPADSGTSGSVAERAGRG